MLDSDSDFDLFDSCNCNSQMHETMLSKTNEFMLNAFLHVSILFTFLVCLYIFIIRDLEVSAFQNSISSIIDNNINSNIASINLKQFSDSYDYKINLLNTLNKKYNLSNTNKDDIDTLTNAVNFISSPKLIDNYIKQYSNPNYVIAMHNNDVINYGIRISIIFFIISIILITVIKLSCSDCHNVIKLIVENLLVAVCVGGVEYWFFINYAVKFEPAPPSLLMTSAINNIISHLS
jgi:hypothetical protein